MFINKIRIKNYKSFLDSGEICIDKNLFGLIGQNNTGKSAVLDAIQCIFPTIKKEISATDFHKGTTKDIEIEVWFDDVTQEYIENVLYKDKLLEKYKEIKKLEEELKKISSKSEKDEINNKIEIINDKLSKDKEKYFKKSIEKYHISDEKFYIKLVCKKGTKILKKFYIDEEKDISQIDLKKILPPIKVIPAIRDPKNESTAGTNSYLKELIQMLDDQIQTQIEIEGNSISYNELNEVIARETSNRCKSLSENITNFYNQAIGNSDYQVIIDSDVNISKGTTYTTKIKDINTNVQSDILSCGTGYQSMVILAILETYVEIADKNIGYILLIEEPEVYLHPTLQRKMIDTLINISSTNQVLFTSHSPITVSKLSKQQIRLVKKDSGVASIENINPQVVINELGIKSDDILVNKGIIFVEGKDDKAVFEILLDKIEEGLSSKINIIDAGNCNNLKFYANAEMLINNKFNIPTLIIRDTDTKEPSIRKTHLINEITSNRNNKLDREMIDKITKSIKIMKRYSLEGYFIDEKLLLISGIDCEDIKHVIQCYECQYNYYTNIIYNNSDKNYNEKLISSWYQPKYLLEKFHDKFKSNRLKDIETYNLRYEKQWRKFERCVDCKKSNIDCYIKTREKINEYTKLLKLQKKDFLIESIKDKSLDTLKETKLKEIVNILEKFIEDIDM